MSRELLSSQDAARRLGITTATLYDWLAQSDAGTFMIRGQPTTINYYQGGRKGQGRIKIDSQELERLLELMFVSPKSQTIRRAPRKQTSMQHITTKLGRPDD
ncbi:MAG: DNA-binding protein [Planctomycetota bacterium]|nr:DNA-binding protein [Planctomycetota bacterium]